MLEELIQVNVEKDTLIQTPFTVWVPGLIQSFLSLFHRTRWIKFEEKVEKGGERWSKPHVATLSLHSLFELRTCIEKGTIMLDLEASSLPQVVGKLTAGHLSVFLCKEINCI